MSVTTTGVVGPLNAGRMLIGGEWVDGATSFAVRHKVTGNVLVQAACASRAQVAGAVAAARESFEQNSLTPYERYEVLHRAAAGVEAHRADLLATIVAESGFTISDAGGEVDRCIQTLLLSGEEAKRVHGEMVPIDGAPGQSHRLAFTLRVPLGVVVAITPFNSPLNTVAHKVAPALAAGNTVVLKPASVTPLSSAWLCEILLQAGLPPAHLNLVQGGGRDVGQWLSEEPDVEFYTFTGSTGVGRQIHQAIGLRRSSLELGSIASTIVCEDADLDWALPRCVNASFRKAGQVCTSVQRLYVERAIVDRFTEMIVARADAAKIGDPYDPATLVGPMIDEGEAVRAQAWVREAVAGGAELRHGGGREGALLEPTILVGVRPDMRVMCEEVFAPVISIVPFDSFEATLDQVNATPYGLAAGVFTKDIDRALHASRRLRVGSVHVNETSSSRVDLMPYGGVKESGFGREGPKYAIEEMTKRETRDHQRSTDAEAPVTPAFVHSSGVFALGVAVALSVSGASHPVLAQGQAASPFNARLFDAWKWRSIGPRLGGRSIAVHGSRSRQLEYYFGATGGGLWKTTDGGTTWGPVTDGFLKSSSVGSIGVCAANPDVVYIGMGEGQWRAQMNTGDGAYASRDAGKTWTFIGLGSRTGQTAITRMRVHPTDCNLVYAAVLGDPYGPNPERGVFRSTDGGKSWTRVLFRSDSAGISDLVMDPSDPRTLYATVWDAVRPPWGGVTGKASGIFKTTDGGDHWSELTRNPGLPKGRVGKIGIAVSGADGNRVYAIIEADPDSAGVFRSSDGGATWDRVNRDNDLPHRAEYYTRIYADPKLVDRVYVLGRNLYRSDDGGRTYRPISTPHGDNQDLWIDPENSDRMIEANDGGANVTVNAGKTWTNRDYTTSQIYSVVATDDYPYLVCGPQQDNSSKCVPSDGDGRFWYLGPAGEQGYIAMHPTKTTLGYGGSQRGGLVRFDRATGQRQNISIWPDMSDGERPNQLRERFQWTFPIVMSPQDPNVVYAGSQHVWRTSNGGLSWDQISPDLTRADPKTLVGSDMPINDHSGTDYYATVFTIALSKHDANVIWAGSDDGRVNVTQDGGKTWQNVTPPQMPEFAKASLITVSPHVPGKAYLAAEKYKLQDVAPYIFKTEDFGKTWTKIVNGIAPDHFVRAVVEDPVRPGLLFAGTEHAPYVSFDDGANWQSLALNLPYVQVADVLVKDNDVVIATFGRGIMVLDDISPLREFSAAVMAEGLHLFKPINVIGTSADAASGLDYRQTVVPGTNALNVSYSLARPAQRVTIEFLDGGGRVVRSFTGTPGTKPRPVVRNTVGLVINGPRWGSSTAEPPVPTDAGLHRFEWDLRYPPATDFAGLRLRDTNADGPRALPGDYRVRMTVDGVAQQQPFKILQDPRLTDVTAADLAAQFSFEMATHRRLNDATSAVVYIRDLKAQILERLAQTQNRAIGTAGRDVATKLSAVEGDIYEVRVAAESDIKHFGPKLVNKIGAVYGAAQSADGRPTTQVQAVFGELSTKLGVQLKRLDEITAADLEKLNELLRRAKLPPVNVKSVAM